MSTMPYKAQDTPDTFTDIDGETLRRDGLATFSVDLHDVEDVARMYRRLRLEHSGFRRCRRNISGLVRALIFHPPSRQLVPERDRSREACLQSRETLPQKRLEG